MGEVVKVDVWSDVACPWCYVGKRRFEEGVRLAREAGGIADVDLEYHSFELSPDTPVDFEGSEVDFLSRHKGLPSEQAARMLAQMTDVAASVGLAFDFAALRHTNTIKAHQVLHLAKAHGLQRETKERLLSAYFTEGRHIGHDADLADLGAEVGLDPSEVVEALAGGTYVEAVRADIAQARAYGIQAVPFFVFDGRYGVPGAQEPETFTRALTQAVRPATD
jgi:predicted DsbA family dithiol-disulfide isomerase